MKKKILIVLIVMSALIIIIGLLSAKSITTQLLDQTMDSGKVIVDGSDMTVFAKCFAMIGWIAIGLSIVFYTFLLVGAIWAVYGITMLIMFIIKKSKNKKNNKDENN